MSDQMFSHPEPSLSFRLQIADPTKADMHFSVAAGCILTITHDGRIERGPHLSDDEATVAFVDCLSKYLPCFLAALRQRAEDAERELAALKAPFIGIAG